MNSFSGSRKLAWAAWIIASVFYAYQYILRVMPNIMLNDIMEQFGMSAASFGQFAGIYYIGYSALHLPVGIMLDRFGPRGVMSGCMLLTVAGLMPLLFADYWVYPVVGRFLIGAGSSAAILGVFKIIRMTFSEARFPRMLSLSVTIGLIGAIYGGGPLSYFRDLFGYDHVIQMIALAGVILAAVTYWIVPRVEITAAESVLSNVKEVLTNKRVIWTCLAAGFMMGPLEGFADVWGTVFFKQVYGFDGTVSASLPSMLYMGMLFGAPILGLIAEKIGDNLITIIGSGIVMTACFGAFLIWHLSPGELTVSLLFSGMACAYQILAIYKASTYVRGEVAGIATAVANMIMMVFGYGFHASMGAIINVMGGESAPLALIYGIAVIPIALAIGTSGFIVIFAKDNQCVEKRSIQI